MNVLSSRTNKESRSIAQLLKVKVKRMKMENERTIDAF